MQTLYKGKDIVTGYYVYGPLYIEEGHAYINDIEAGLVPVDVNTIKLDDGNEQPDSKRVLRTASDFGNGE